MGKIPLLRIGRARHGGTSRRGTDFRRRKKVQRRGHRGSGRCPSGRRPRKQWMGLRRRSVRPSGRSHFLRGSSGDRSLRANGPRKGNRRGSPRRRPGSDPFGVPIGNRPRSQDLGRNPKGPPSKLASTGQARPARERRPPSPATRLDPGQVGAGGNTGSHFAFGECRPALRDRAAAAPLPLSTCGESETRPARP